ncbi:MAG: metal ABC transporter permease [bacterium]|nr:metal ABC transporter permease [bacterium]
MNPFDLIALIFTDYTIRTVMMGALVLGIVSGTLSAFAVLRKQSLLGDTMSHAALPGVIIAFLITGERAPLPLLVGAMLAGLLGTLFMGVVTSQTRIKHDSAQGVVLAVFFGFGMALLSWVVRQPGAEYAGLDQFLFGQAAATVEADVRTMAVIGGAALLVIALFWKEIKLVSFDPGYAHTLGMRVSLMNIAITSLIGVAVVVGLQMVGVVLMSAMIVAPGAAARQWTNRLGMMVVISAVFGAVAGVSGAWVSAAGVNVPTGPVIVLSATLIVVFSIFFAPNRGLVWESVRQQRRRAALANRRAHAEVPVGSVGSAEGATKS